MAFKGIDFAALGREMEKRRALPPEEREMLEAREEFARNARDIVKDEALRSEASSQHRVFRLVAPAYQRFGIDGSSVTNMHFVNAEGERMNAVYKQSKAEQLSDQASHDPSMKWQAVGRLEEGSLVSVLGEPTTRNWRDMSGNWHTAKEFTASRMEPGVHDRAALEAKALIPLVTASLRHEQAADDPSRQAIAREYLGQPAVSPGAASVAKGVDVRAEPMRQEAQMGR
jgi:hypothetical protein